jgi:hypothetical protein
MESDRARTREDGRRRSQKCLALMVRLLRGHSRACRTGCYEPDRSTGRCLDSGFLGSLLAAKVERVFQFQLGIAMADTNMVSLR